MCVYIYIYILRPPWNTTAWNIWLLALVVCCWLLVVSCWFCLVSCNCSLLTARYSLLAAHCSLLTAHCSLLATHCSLLTAHCSLCTARSSRLVYSKIGIFGHFYAVFALWRAAERSTQFVKCLLHVWWATVVTWNQLHWLLRPFSGQTAKRSCFLVRCEPKPVKNGQNRLFLTVFSLFWWPGELQSAHHSL